MTPEEQALWDVYDAGFGNRDSLRDAIIKLATAEEREACAKIADSADESAGGPVFDTGVIWRSSAARAIAKAIRARLSGGTPQ